jgi:NAD(P)-dependent dehydrogenase (short-subunit alcohol dehydrogenase family)
VERVPYEWLRRVIQLTRSIAAMYGRQGVRCNAICPGYILTPSGEKAFDDDMKATWRRHTVIDRHGQSDDVARLAVYLASDESQFMTGQALVIDGGFTMHEPMWQTGSTWKADLRRNR